MKPRNVSRNLINATLAAAVGLAALSCGNDLTGQGEHGLGTGGGQPQPTPGPDPVLFVAIDSLHPGYLKLDRNGDAGGHKGNWLMPNVHRYLLGATRFANSRAYMPSATDMNHLNVIAGTHSGQTGIIGVSTQLYDWHGDTTPRWESPHLAWARDGKGRKVQTLFQLWAQKHKLSRTAFISGKGWVSDMYRKSKEWNHDPGISLVVQGNDHPLYVPRAAPYKRSFYDPPNDADAACDPESKMQQAFDDLIYKRDRDSLEHFPPDAWVVDATLAVLRRERPGFSLVLLAQLDDAQHALGTAFNPGEFVKPKTPYVPPAGCVNKPGYQLVSKYNPLVYREAVLDTVRDVDAQFGRLMAGIAKLPAYRNATVVLYSDHSQITHLLQQPKDRFSDSTDPIKVLRRKGALTKAEADWKGFGVMSASGLGALYWHPQKKDRAKAIARARLVLQQHQITNPVTGQKECPWHVLDRKQMKQGYPGVTVAGELFHDYYATTDGSKHPVWPDLVLVMKNNWQITVYDGMLGNLGVEIPFPLPPLTVFLGGHGAHDTLPIVMAMSGPGIARGKVIDDPKHVRDFRIADLGVTVARRAGLVFPHTTVGRDRRLLLK